MKYIFLIFIYTTLLFSSANSSVVRMITSLGIIDIELYEDEAPTTVANFLHYVNQGDYDNTVIHRRVSNFIVQGGGYNIDSVTGSLTHIATVEPIINEYSSAIPNERGTIAMAKIAGDPDSATSQWFFNVIDNNEMLGAENNGGFTVFGKVLGKGMEIVDAIESLPIVNLGILNELPYVRMLDSGDITTVSIRSVKLLATEDALDIDRLFNYLEQNSPELFAPAGSSTGLYEGYNFRYYSGTQSYLGTKDGRVYYLGPASNNQISDIGSYEELLNYALASGY